MGSVLLRVLGPVGLEADAESVYLARRQQRLILGILAIDANRLVSSDRLIDMLWGGHPPRRARAVIQTRVSELRSVLAKYLEPPHGVVTRERGYMLSIPPEAVDLNIFQSVVRQANTAGSDERARDLLRSALGLWRGDVLGGWLPMDSHVALCSSIEAARLSAVEALFELELRLGNVRASVDEMVEAASRNPARERLIVHAMTALQRVGRTAEALQLFELCRRWLADELGVDPSAELRQLHLAILTGDDGPEPMRSLASDRPPASAQPSGGAVAVSRQAAQATPHLLPGDVPDFTGRSVETALVVDALTGTEKESRVAVVTGAAGVGKTALCVHVAHLLQTHFPDGQLYVDLHGFDRPQSVQPRDALTRFLRALGVDSVLPDSVDERAELYRSTVAGRQVLVVLDNARDANQIRPLMPGNASCAVVITSRTRVAAAIGADSIDLDVLTESQAIDLLSCIAGQARVSSDLTAATRLVNLCGRLPLAIRVAAARLVAKPHWSVAKLAARLSDERKRLDQLTYGDLDVRASIALSYAGLASDAQRLLCYLGDLDLPEVNVWTAAALLDLHPAEAEEVLEHLHDAQLMDVIGWEASGFSRYRLHDLVRLFAKERAASDESPTMLSVARQRAYSSWLYLVEMAYSTVYGGAGFENIRSPAPRYVVDETIVATLAKDPLSWFMMERINLVMVIRKSAHEGLSSLCWGLACTAFSLFEMCRHFDECGEALDVALAVTVRSGDDQGRGAVLHRLAIHSANRNDHEMSMSYSQQAAEYLERCGEGHGHSLAILHIGSIYRQEKRLDAALTHLEAAAHGLKAAADPSALALALRNIAQAQLDAGNFDATSEYLEQALEVARGCKSQRREAQVLFNQGLLWVKQRRIEDAQSVFAEVLAIARTLGDRPGQIQANRGLAQCYEQRGEFDRAEQTLLTALQLAHQSTPSLLETMVRDELRRLAELRNPSN